MSTAHPTCLTVQLPLAVRRQPGPKTVVTPDGKVTPTAPRSAAQTHGDPALIKALARAFRYQRMLEEGWYASITGMAEAEKLDRGYMGRLLQLTLLPPRIVEARLDGRAPTSDLPQTMDSWPAAWDQQRTLLG